jgi:hypothetical protein
MVPQVAALTALIFLAAIPSTQMAGYNNGICTVSPTVHDRPPDDPNASSFASPGGTWFANDSRTLWAWWWGRMSDGGYKVLWVRPGQALTVTGKRLDSASAALKGRYTGRLLQFVPGQWSVFSIRRLLAGRCTCRRTVAALRCADSIARHR